MHTLVTVSKVVMQQHMHSDMGTDKRNVFKNTTKMCKHYLHETIPLKAFFHTSVVSTPLIVLPRTTLALTLALLMKVITLVPHTPLPLPTVWAMVRVPPSITHSPKQRVCINKSLQSQDCMQFKI